ncbi:MAG: DUF1598 domain-containing protein [Pirellulales bacterium]
MTRNVLRGGVGLRGGGIGWMLATFFLSVLGLSTSGGMPSPAQAADGDDLQARLEAGEFAPVVRAAQAAPVADRDAVLQQVGAAQAKAGLRRASLDTVRGMSDDRSRNAALQDMPRGGLPGMGFGGVPQPDFDSLIELITSTIEPQSWDEVGGPGTIEEFRGGVSVDAHGFVNRNLNLDDGDRLQNVRAAFAPTGVSSPARRASPMRKVSLNRLEREVQLRLAAGQPLSEEMKLLAGLQRIQYVLIYPESGDIVLAGPASDWRTDREGRIVGVESNHPIMRLDDLVVVLRHRRDNPQGEFGCSIEPRPESLQATHDFLEESAKKPLKPGKAAREAWLAQLSAAMGQQDIRFDGVDATTHVARVMFEADYRMKLVGIGLEETTFNVPSYLDLVQAAQGDPPPLGVLRWWFTINYQSLSASPNRDVYEFHGQGVKVLSENEMLDARGQRVHTGLAQPLNQEFAQNFTKNFPALAEKYPVYGELQNVFDLALAAALIQGEDLPARVGWHMTCFGDAEQYQVPREHPPATVQTVINHRVVERGKILAAASGGVTVNPIKLVSFDAIKVEKSNRLESQYRRGEPADVARTGWWWD